MAREMTAKAWARVAMLMIATAILSAGRLMESVYSMSSETGCWGCTGSGNDGPPARTSSRDFSVSGLASSLRIDRVAVDVYKEHSMKAIRYSNYSCGI